MASLPVLEVDALSFAHAGQPPLFRQWSASIGPGLTWVLGGESRGKTTLLQLLAGVLIPAAGHLRHLGLQGAGDRHPVFLADPHNPDHDALPAHQLVAQLAAADPGFDHAALPAHVAGLGLAAHWHKPMYMLSTGSRRKVWHAAALASSAPLRLMDMPFAALDTASIRYLVQALAGAAGDPHAAWVLADYEAHPALAGTAVITLGD